MSRALVWIIGLILIIPIVLALFLYLWLSLPGGNMVIS